MPQTIEREKRPGVKIDSSGADDSDSLQDLIYRRANNKISDAETWKAYDKIVQESRGSVVKRVVAKLRKLV